MASILLLMAPDHLLLEPWAVGPLEGPLASSISPTRPTQLPQSTLCRVQTVSASPAVIFLAAGKTPLALLSDSLPFSLSKAQQCHCFTLLTTLVSKYGT